MTKLFTKIMAVILLLMLHIGSISAQTTVTWPLTATTLVAVDTPTGTGFTASDQTQSGINQLSWTGYGFDGAQNCERVKGNYLNGSTATALPTTFQTDCYVEYAVSATTGYNLTVTSIDMYIGGGGTTSIFAQILYSTDNFSTSTTLDAGGTAFGQNSATVISHKSFSGKSILVAAGNTIKIRVYPKYTGSASTGKYLINSNVKVTFTATPIITTPTISKTSGDNPATVMENYPLTPVVFNYINVADDANVISNWYTDNTYTTTTTAPSGLSIDKNTTAKTVTVSGTPALSTAGTYYYQLSVNEPSGNTVQGSVIVTPYVAPTPAITAPKANTQYVRAGETATAAFTISNGTGATVEGLPTGLSGSYSSGTYTISGTVECQCNTG